MKNINSRIANNKKSIIFTCVSIILICIICIAVTPITFQNDTFYTIKIGEHIQNVGIDMEDPFSWHENLEYTYPHWLYDLITYKVYSIWQFKGIYIFTCFLACILGISIYYTNLRLTKSDLMSFFTSILTIYLIRPFIAARAQLVTFILFVWTIYFIEEFLKSKKIFYAIGLFIIAILIANLHVAVFPFFFILFLPYLAEYITCLLIENKKYKTFMQKKILKKISRLSKKDNNEEKINELNSVLEKIQIENEEKMKSKADSYKIIATKNKNVPLLIAIMLICILAGLLTPLGTTPYTYLIKTMIGNTTQHISEHLPLTLFNDAFSTSFLIVFILVLTFTKSKIKLRYLYLMIGLIFLSFMSRRQSSLMMLLGSFVLCDMIVRLIIKKYNKNLSTYSLSVPYSFTYSFIIFITISLCYLPLSNKFSQKFVDETNYPVAACDYICENIDLENARFFNEYNYGSYMLFRNIPVFIDSRADLYSPEFNNTGNDIFLDCIDLTNSKYYYEDIFKKYNITHIILKKDSLINVDIQGSHDENYKELYSDDYFIVYERLNTI